jgi:hypothetical protein
LESAISIQAFDKKARPSRKRSVRPAFKAVTLKFKCPATINYQKEEIVKIEVSSPWKKVSTYGGMAGHPTSGITIDLGPTANFNNLAEVIGGGTYLKCFYSSKSDYLAIGVKSPKDYNCQIDKPSRTFTCKPKK